MCVCVCVLRVCEFAKYVCGCVCGEDSVGIYTYRTNPYISKKYIQRSAAKRNVGGAGRAERAMSPCE